MNTATQMGQGRAQPLDGVRVVEIGGWVSAAFAGKILADLGAEVVVVEPSGGGALRRYGPFPGGKPDPEKSGLHLYLSTNKMSATLDLERDEARPLLQRLTAGADVIVHDAPRAEAERLGITYEALRAGNDGLIALEMSPFGQTGPYAGYKGFEINAAALGGVMMQLGLPGRPPLNPPLFIGHYQAGLTGAMAVMIALTSRGPLGGGQRIDLAESDSWATFHTGNGVVQWLFGDRRAMRHGRRVAGGPYPNTILACKDGEIRLQAMTKREWRRIIDMMGNPAWADDPRFQDRLKMNELYADELDGLIADWLSGQTKDELFRKFYDFSVPFTPVNTAADFLHHPHLAAREYFIEVEHPKAGTLRQPGPPYKLAKTPCRIRRPAPLLGEHNDHAFDAAPVPAKENAGTASDGNTTGFERIRVLDLGWVWAGAVAGHVLADMGAEVIKVETRKRLDPARQGRPIVGDVPDPEQNPLFHNVNRGKKSLTIDITTPEGRDLVLRLAAISDVVVENMSPHALAKAGLDYPNMRRVNPQIVMLSYPVMGQTGPFNELRGYGNAAGALVGLDSLGADPDGDDLCGFNHVLGDPAAGQFAVIALLAALRRRDKTGEGQYVDLSMVESVGTMLGEATMAFEMNGEVAEARGNRHPFLAPHGAYPCAGDDKWAAIAVETAEEWRALCAVIGRGDLAGDASLTTYEGRMARRAEIDRAIAAWTRERSHYDVTETLQAHGVAATPCLDQEGRFFDPHLQARECYVDTDHPVLGSEPLYGIPYKLSARPGAVRGRAPLLGEHNTEVLGDLLGVPPTRQAELVEMKAVY